MLHLALFAQPRSSPQTSVLPFASTISLPDSDRASLVIGLLQSTIHLPLQGYYTSVTFTLFIPARFGIIRAVLGRSTLELLTFETSPSELSSFIVESGRKIDVATPPAHSGSTNLLLSLFACLLHYMVHADAVTPQIVAMQVTYFI